MNFALIMNFLTMRFVFFGIYHTFYTEGNRSEIALIDVLTTDASWTLLRAPDLSFLLSRPQQLLPCYGTLAPLLHCWAAQKRLYSGKHTSSCSSDLSTNRDDVRWRRSLEEPGFLKMEAQGQGQATCFFCPASRLVDGFYILTKATAYRYAKLRRGSGIYNSYQKKSIHIVPCKTDGK